MFDILCPKNGTYEDVLKSENFLPYGSAVVDFFQQLSKNILQNSNYKKYPEIIALGFWLRKANLIKMQKDVFEKETTKDNIKLARGLVFHIAPSNVDTVFAYSLFVSLLMGNRNIVRVSSQSSLVLDLLITELNDILSLKEFKSLRNNLLIVRYEHNDDTTTEFSLRCDVRVIWGGDQTVNKIRSLPLNTSAHEIVFPDRFSYCAVKSKEFLSLNHPFELTDKFYKDVYTFDQNACSSPRMIFWIGSSEDNQKAQEKFWSCFNEVVESYSGILEQDHSLRKLNSTIITAVTTEGKVKIINGSTNRITRVQFDSLKDVRRDDHCGLGLFYEVCIKDLNELSSFFSSKDQTLSVYGFSNQEISDCLNKGCRSISRVVPIGKALEFDVVWDGYNLFDELTREVSIVS